jgi:hypothetical protein
MDYQNRGGQNSAPAAAPPKPTHNSKKTRGKGMRALSAVLLLAVAILIAFIPLYIVTSSNKGESSYLQDEKFQAVFLEGGQVYFGKIQSINDDFMTMNNIYYLRVNEQVQPDTTDAAGQQDISLAKLGCELHGPDDEMVITRSQVSFWENLKDDGQVTKAINEFVKQNPDGQKCTDPASE